MSHDAVELRLHDALRRARTLDRRGRVVQAFGTTVRATGLNARIGQQVEIRDPAGGPVVKAEVVGLSDGAAILTPLTSLNGLGPEAEVIAADDRTEVPSGPGLLGRVIDAFGRPLDDLGPIAGPVALREDRKSVV